MYRNAATLAIETPAGLHDLDQDRRVGPDEWYVDRVLPSSPTIWLVAFYLALFIIRPWERLVPWMAAVHFERIYALLLIAIVFITRGFRLRFNLQDFAVLAFLGAASLSAFFAWDIQLAWTAADGLYMYLTLVVFYIVLIWAVRTPHELFFLVTCYVVTMGVYLLKCQWEFSLYDNALYGQGLRRMQGIDRTFGHPNDVAASIVLSLPLFFFLYRTRAVMCREWPGWLRKVFTIGLVSYVAVAGVSIVWTYSRTGMVSSVAFLGLVAMRGRRWENKLGAALVGMVLLTVIWMTMPQQSRDRFRSIWDKDAASESAEIAQSAHDSAMGRLEGLLAGIEMLRDSPWTGIGIGNFIAYRERHVDGVPLASHNAIGQLLGQTGIVGACAFLLFVAAILRNTARIRRAAAGNHDMSLVRTLDEFAVAGRDCILLLLLTGLFAHNIYRFNWLWLAAFLGLATEFMIRVRRELDHLPEEHVVGNLDRTTWGQQTVSGS